MMNRLLFIFGVIALLAAGACSEKRELSEMPTYEGPLLIAKNVEILMSDSAISRILLTAPVQHEMKSGDREFPEGLHMEFMELDGHVSSTVDAQKGTFFKEKNLWKVTGNVILEGLDEGERLSTEELWWDPAKREVFTEDDVKVTIRQGDNLVTGTGLWALQDFSQYTLENTIVNTTIETEESEEEAEAAAMEE